MYSKIAERNSARVAQPAFGASCSSRSYVTASLANLHDTAVFDATGHPALSVPCGFSDGLPIGMMLVGRHFDDATVLRAGHAFQAA
jgi:amidase